MAKVGISQKSEKIEKNLRKLRYFTDFDNKLYLRHCKIREAAKATIEIRCRLERGISV